MLNTNAYKVHSNGTDVAIKVWIILFHNKIKYMGNLHYLKQIQ